MARRLPRRATSDQLTLLGFASMLGAAGCCAAAGWHPAALLGVPVLLLLNWAGDSLDGTLARIRNQPRPRDGFYVARNTVALYRAEPLPRTSPR